MKSLSSIARQAKNRERRARYYLDKMGYRLKKSRTRNPSDIEYECYMIVKQDSNQIVAGGSPHAFSMTLKDVERFIYE
jgi:hypothetical protein